MLWVRAQDTLSCLQGFTAHHQAFSAIKRTPPMRGFSGRVVCLHSLQSKNSPAVIVEQLERERSNVAQARLCSY